MRLIDRAELAALWNVPSNSVLFARLDGGRIGNRTHYRVSDVDAYMARCVQNFSPTLTVAQLREKKVELIKVKAASNILGTNSRGEIKSILSKPETLYIQLSTGINRVCRLSLLATEHLTANNKDSFNKGDLCRLLRAPVAKVDSALRVCGLSDNRARNHRRYFALARGQVVKLVGALSTIPVAPAALLTKLESGTLEIVPSHLAVRRLGTTKRKFAEIFFREPLAGLRIPDQQNYQAILGVTEQSLQDYLQTK